MPSVMRRSTTVFSALALGLGAVIVAPAAHSQDSDVLTMDLLTAGDSTFGANDYYWCADGSKPSSKVPPPSGSCNFPRNKEPMQLLSGQSVSATVSTTSQGATSFSVTGNCSIGTSSYNFPSAPAPTTTAQIANGGTFYLTVLGQGATCVLTGTTPGSATHTGSSSAFTVTSPINYDAITMNVASVGDQTYGTGAVYWCNDKDAPSSDTCGFSVPPKNTLQLGLQETVKATVFTTSNNGATFSVAGNCSLGTSPWDSSSPRSTSAQVAGGDSIYLTALATSGQCVMTGTTPGSSSLSPGSYTYTVDLSLRQQQPTTALPSRKRMRVGQRLQLQGTDGISTDAGQPVSWRVLRSSRENCRLIKSSSGAVTLRAVSRGTCRVQASAPAVQGKYARFTDNLTVRVR